MSTSVDSQPATSGSVWEPEPTRLEKFAGIGMAVLPGLLSLLGWGAYLLRYEMPGEVEYQNAYLLFWALALGTAVIATFIGWRKRREIPDGSAPWLVVSLLLTLPTAWVSLLFLYSLVVR